MDYTQMTKPKKQARDSVEISEVNLIALPNQFPFNEMLLNGTLRLGKFAVKTRPYIWQKLGLILLYTSKGRINSQCANAHGLKSNNFPLGAIVGVGKLVDARKLTPKEKQRLFSQFNNLGKKKKRDRSQRYVYPLPYGLFFESLKRFKNPVAFTAVPGPVREVKVPIELVTNELKKLGIDPAKCIR